MEYFSRKELAGWSLVGVGALVGAGFLLNSPIADRDQNTSSEADLDARVVMEDALALQNDVIAKLGAVCKPELDANTPPQIPEPCVRSASADDTKFTAEVSKKVCTYVDAKRHTGRITLTATCLTYKLSQTSEDGKNGTTVTVYETPSNPAANNISVFRDNDLNSEVNVGNIVGIGMLQLRESKTELLAEGVEAGQLILSQIKV